MTHMMVVVVMMMTLMTMTTMMMMTMMIHGHFDVYNLVGAVFFPVTIVAQMPGWAEALAGKLAASRGCSRAVV